MIQIDAMWLGIIAQVIVFGFFGGRLYGVVDECKRDVRTLFEFHDKHKERSDTLTDRLARIEVGIEHLTSAIEKNTPS